MNTLLRHSSMRAILVWSFVIASGIGSMVFLALVVAPSARAAGGCGGG